MGQASAREIILPKTNLHTAHATAKLDKQVSKGSLSRSKTRDRRIKIRTRTRALAKPG